MGLFKKKETVKEEPILMQDEKENDYKIKLKNAKKELEKLQKELLKYKNEEKETNKKHLETEKDLNEKKRQLFEANEQIKGQYEALQRFEREIKEEREKRQKAEQQVKDIEIEKEKMKQAFSKIKQKMDSAIGNRKSAEREANRTHGILKKQNQELKQYTWALHVRNEKIKELESSLDKFLLAEPSELITLLNERLSKETFKKFNSLVGLYKRYVVIEGINALQDISMDETADGKVEYGFLVKNHLQANDKWFFMTTDSRSFEVVGHKNGELKLGTPVSAIVNEEKNQAYVNWYFTSEEQMEEEKAKNRHKKIKLVQKEKEDYSFIGPLSVLLVTSKNGIKYRERLKKHGVLAEWMDPYEKNPVHIRNKSNSFDILLLMEDAMPHDTRTIINEYKREDEDKVQTMYNHNEEAVVARVRYVAWKKGCLQVHSQKDLVEQK